MGHNPGWPIISDLEWLGGPWTGPDRKGMREMSESEFLASELTNEQIEQLSKMIEASEKTLPWYRRRYAIARVLFGEMGQITLEFVPFDLWVGLYLAPRAVYIGLLPTVIIEVIW